ncbi:MAG: PilW family protein [Candidatus Tectimicrobiota bacterium]
MGLRSQHGFSLIELMMALALGSVVIASMYGTVVQQQRVVTRQEHVAEVNQTVRLAMDAMLTELRGAGYDPDGTAGAGIIEADATHIRFTRDLNCNGSIAQSGSAAPALGVLDRNDEDVAYTIDLSQVQRLDLHQGELQRTVFNRTADPTGLATGGAQPVASNIVAGGFCYFLASDLTTCVPNPAPLDAIRMVQVTLTARASAPDPQHTEPGVPADSPFKHYRQATLTSRLYLRNIGVQRGLSTEPQPFNNPCPLR